MCDLYHPPVAWHVVMTQPDENTQGSAMVCEE